MTGSGTSFPDALWEGAGALPWPELTRGILLRRYKRFLADVELADGTEVTVHCPNSGSMMECSMKGAKVYLSSHESPRRRYRYTWEMIEMPTSLVGVNTLVPNRLVRASIGAGWIPGLQGYSAIRSEVPYGNRSRIDLLLTGESGRCYVEVKNCTLVRDRVALFPDAVTERGRKHLVELQEQVRRGDEAVMFCLVQRMDADVFRPADHIDPDYGRELRRAVSNGVRFMVYDVHLDARHIRLNRSLPFEL